jgi:hypothetical protein
MINFTIGVFIKVLVLAVLTAFVVSCGADPDDYKVKESDGCASDDLECLENKASAEEELGSSTTEANGNTNQENKGKDSITIENNITVNNNIGDSEVTLSENADNCMAGKLCRGMTKSEVLDAIGVEPATMKLQGSREIWEWNLDFSGPVCGSYSCRVIFAEGIVINQENMKGEYIDIENF